MLTILIEDIHDIVVDASRSEVKIDYISKTGAVIARIEMSCIDKEFEIQRTQEALGRV